MGGIYWLNKYFSLLLHFSDRKLKKVSFVSDGQFREGSLNFEFHSVNKVKL